MPTAAPEDRVCILLAERTRQAPAVTAMRRRMEQMGKRQNENPPLLTERCWWSFSSPVTFRKNTGMLRLVFPSYWTVRMPIRFETGESTLNLPTVRIS